MKTSIFNMTLTLPPMIGMVEVEKDMPMCNHNRNAMWPLCPPNHVWLGDRYENIHL